MSDYILFSSYFLLIWYFKYYIVSPIDLSSNSGLIFRRTESIDLAAIRSVKVEQGLFGRIFRYGTLRLESPLLEKIFVMEKIPEVFKHASIIEEARLEQITHEDNQIIIPSA